MKLIALLLLLLTLSSTEQTCATGCLKCDTTGNCIVPDISAGYVLTNNAAVKSTAQFCLVIDSTGKCTTCNPKYFLDQSTSNCVVVPTANLINNCLLYGSLTSCSFCGNNTYLNNNVCAAVTTTISNCTIYKDAATCSVCASGSVLAVDGKSCVSVSSVQNCSGYTFVTCSTCASGYYLNKNSYLSSALKSGTADQNTALAKFTRDLIQNTNYTGIFACQNGASSNCATFAADSSTCTTCNANYYLDKTTGLCTAFPSEPIPFCSVYTSATTCTACNSGYTLSNNACTVIPTASLVDKCATYDGTASSAVCRTCSPGYYLNQNQNSCSARVNSVNISNCGTVNPNADQCSACLTGYFLSNDFVFCFPNIPNCKIHQPTASTATLQCGTCITNYYLVAAVGNGQNSCAQGPVNNCETYGNSTTNCSTCQLGFYLSNNTCVTQPTIANCSIFSPTAGICATCNVANYFAIAQPLVCQNITANLITGCILYNGTLAAPTCQKCDSGYFLSSNTCTQFTMPNCLIATALTTCQKCKSGYYLNYNSSGCVLPFASVTPNCSSDGSLSGNISITQQSCNTCNTGTFPISATNTYTCVSLTETAQLNAGTALTAGACLKYAANLNCVQCDPSVPNFLLETSANPPTCVSTCASTQTRKYVLIPTINQIGQVNVCTAANPNNNCTMVAPELTDPSLGEVCIKCASTTSSNAPVYTEIPLSTGADYGKYSNVNPNGTMATATPMLTGFFPSIYTRTPKVTCTTAAGPLKLLGNTISSAVSIANCEYYFQVANNDYGCARCLSGNTGTITNLSGTNYINTCTTDANVLFTNPIANLDIRFANYINVTGCPNNNAGQAQVPVFVYKQFGSSNPTLTGFAPYTFSGNSITSTSGGKSITCVQVASVASAPNTALGTWGGGYNGGNSGGYVGCGLVGVGVQFNGVYDSAASPYGNFCLACSPGYKGTLIDPQYTFAKATCTQIPNCAAGSTIYNGCSLCSPGNVLLYDTNLNNINTETCLPISPTVSSKMTNCYAGASDGTGSPSAISCKVCKQGFMINGDGYCQTITPANCSTNGFIGPAVGSTVLNLEWSLYINGNAPGCNRCLANYVAVNLTTMFPIICVTDSYQAIADALPANTVTVYKPNCKYYANQISPISCNACQSGFVNGTNGIACYPVAGLQNCQTASSATVCTSCLNASFSLSQAGVCAAGNLPNCAAYNFSTPSQSGTTQTCTLCNAGYYLLNGVCTPGSVVGCAKQTNNPNRCATCATGLYKVDYSSVNGGTYPDLCIPVAAANGCDTFAIDSSGNYSCTKCTSSINQLPAAIPSNTAGTICLAYNPVQFCATHDTGTILSASFTCQTCIAGYYLTTSNSCKARSTINNCSTFTSNLDTCATCATGYFLTNNGLSCTLYPFGVYKCLTYSNATTCSTCKNGFYLSNNACIAITATISGCVTYSAANTCSACGPNLFLSNNTCVNVTAQNCLGVASATACSSCSGLNILQSTTSTSTNNGVTTTTTTTNCVASGKSNCATVDYNAPNNCLSCTGVFYLSNGACVAATAITNCTTYASATTCSQCASTYMISADGKTCTNDALYTPYNDANCANSQIVTTPACSRCGPGKYFANGACTGSCTITGCLACDPANSSKCFVCNTNYYQDTTGNCVANTTPVEKIGTNIFGALSALMIVLVVMFK